VEAKKTPVPKKAKEEEVDLPFLPKQVINVSSVKRGSQMAILPNHASMIAKANANAKKKALPEPTVVPKKKEESDSSSGSSSDSGSEAKKEASSQKSSEGSDDEEEEGELEFEESEHSVASSHSSHNEGETVEDLKKIPNRKTVVIKGVIISEYEQRKRELEKSMKDALALYARPITEAEYLDNLIEQKSITKSVPRASVVGEINLKKFDKRKTRLERDLEMLKELKEEYK